MAEITLEHVQALADSAQVRATRCHTLWEETEIPNHLNDYFYWIGHANAYKGIVAMAELQTVVEDEMDATPQCP